QPPLKHMPAMIVADRLRMRNIVNRGALTTLGTSRWVFEAARLCNTDVNVASVQGEVARRLKVRFKRSHIESRAASTVVRALYLLAGTSDASSKTRVTF